jgi:tRNA threonylcarbamoyl adenosine modification protein (Sua5/YciO/YrdC/YwlC family)
MNDKSKTLPIDHPQAFSQAEKLVQTGGVIVFPTDTVYGIGASAFQKDAIEGIYRIKSRSHQKAIPILLADTEDLQKITPPLSPTAERLVKEFWPGALTLILPLLPSLPKNLSYTPTIGVRIPDHETARALLRVTGPLATTSANISGEPPALTANQVIDGLGSLVQLILDGGRAPGGISSTVVDCSGEEPRLLRQGPLSWEKIQDFLDKLS